MFRLKHERLVEELPDMPRISYADYELRDIKKIIGHNVGNLNYGIYAL